MLHFYTPPKVSSWVKNCRKEIGESWNGRTKPYENIFTAAEG